MMYDLGPTRCFVKRVSPIDLAGTIITLILGSHDMIKDVDAACQ